MCARRLTNKLVKLLPTPPVYTYCCMWSSPMHMFGRMPSRPPHTCKSGGIIIIGKENGGWLHSLHPLPLTPRAMADTGSGCPSTPELGATCMGWGSLVSSRLVSARLGPADLDPHPQHCVLLPSSLSSSSPAVQIFSSFFLEEATLLL